MTRITMKSKIGPDGVLRVAVPVGTAEADREVQLTIEPIVSEAAPRQEYLDFLRETAGAWQGDFERPEQGQYEGRDAF